PMERAARFEPARGLVWCSVFSRAQIGLYVTNGGWSCLRFLMLVAVMEIGHVGVGVLEDLVAVRMGVGLRAFVASMVVLVVFVVNVPVLVLQGLVNVRVG